MKHRLSLFVALVLCGGLLAGCSNEVHDPHVTCWCPTDALAKIGQDSYYGRFTACWSDGHAIPVTFGHECVYYDDSTEVTASSTSVYTSTSVSTSKSVSASTPVYTGTTVSTSTATVQEK